TTKMMGGHFWIEISWTRPWSCFASAREAAARTSRPSLSGPSLSRMESNLQTKAGWPSTFFRWAPMALAKRGSSATNARRLPDITYTPMFKLGIGLRRAWTGALAASKLREPVIGSIHESWLHPVRAAQRDNGVVDNAVPVANPFVGSLP